MIKLTDLKPGMYVQAGKTVYKVSNVYPDWVTVQVVYPVPDRTLVRSFANEEFGMTFKWPTAATVVKVNRAYAKEATS